MNQPDWLRALRKAEESLEDKDAIQRLMESGATLPQALQAVEMDRKYTMDDLKKMCKESGVSVSGDKATLALKIIKHKEINAEGMDRPT